MLFGFVGLQKTEDEDSLTYNQVYKDLYRNKFSDYIMPVAYDEDQKIFYNQDDTIGFAFECVPVLVFGINSLKTLEGLFRVAFPSGSVLQWILYADPNIKEIMDYYEYPKQHAPDFVKKAYHELRKFYEERKTGNPPVRNHRLFFTVKIPVKLVTENLLKEITSSVEDTLRSVLLSPERMTAGHLLRFYREVLNVDLPGNLTAWCKNTELRKQVILSNTEIEIDPSEGFVVIRGDSGERFFRCITAKTMPQEIDPFWANRVTGSYDGISGDVSQINTPFIFTLNILVEDLKGKIHTKANLVLQQQAFGSFIPALKRKQEEFLWAADRLEKGERFFRIIPTVWVFSSDKEQTRTASYRVVKLWEGTGAVMQEDRGILGPLFVYSLPFGLFAHEKTLQLLDRDFIVPAESLPPLIPAQADYMGTGEPLLIFAGRKGQLIGLNIFSKGSSNYNFYVAAPTGKGKSFTVNYITANYYGAGAKIRIIDIGGSYKKLVNIFGGRFLEFSPESDICINPFSNIKEPDQDIPVIAEIILQMAISSTGRLPENINQETASNLIRIAVEWAIRNFGADASVDHVQQWLSAFPEYLEDRDMLCEGKEACVEDFRLIATHLAFNLTKFTSTGPYGKWFSGKSNFDISQDDFVVLELEHLKTLKDLFTVVVLQVLNAATMDLYLSSREVPRLVIVDEAWQFLQDTPQFQKVIEEGYRRARKYQGSFGIITQSITDLIEFGRVGRIININSAFKFFLESTDFELAREKKLIDYDDFTMEILKSIKYNAPKYSEIFIHSDAFGVGVARLMVDPYSYYIYTSNPKEIAEIESMVKAMSYEEAINKMVEKYRKD